MGRTCPRSGALQAGRRSSPRRGDDMTCSVGGRAVLLRAELHLAQRDVEVDAVIHPVHVTARELLDPSQPVAERVDMYVELVRGLLPLPSVVEEGVERSDETAAVLGVVRDQRL